MDYIDSESYCEKCKKTVTARRMIPKMTWYYKTLSYLTLGFWPIYWIRVRWKCRECGGNADAEKVHIVARSMGGLRNIEEIHTLVSCPSCRKDTQLRRKLPQPSSLHQLLSFFSGGTWSYNWLQFGWKCTECSTTVDGDSLTPSALIPESKGFCHSCGKDVNIRRRMPVVTYRFMLLSFITMGSLPFHWFNFGWDCAECGTGPDVKQPPVPKDIIRLQRHCSNCHQDTIFQKKPPSLTIIDRLLSIFSGGWWSIFRINSGWRCSRCSTKIKVNFF